MSGNGRILLEQAFLLHRRSYRESSFLLEFLTYGHGRVAILGKGVRRRKGAAAAVLFPFAPLRISWAGRGELPVLTDVEATGGSSLTEPEELACGLYLNELVMRLLALLDPHPEIFELYRETIGRLASGDRREAALRTFEVLLLSALGYGLPLDCDVSTGDGVEPDRLYRYVIEYGPVATLAHPDAIRGSALIALRTGVFSSMADLKDAKRLMRGVIAHHLGGRGLKSRELFKYRQT